MQFDFTSILDRRGKDAMAVDAIGENGMFPAPKEGFDAIPMWVADMNFPTVPTVPEAIIARAVERACGSCPCRKGCRERLAPLPESLLHISQILLDDDETVIDEFRSVACRPVLVPHPFRIINIDKGAEYGRRS